MQGFIRIYFILGIYLRRKNTFPDATLTFYGTSILNCLLNKCYKCYTVNLITQDLPGSLVAQMVKNPPAMQETKVQSLSQEDPLEKEMVTHSSILAWRIPWAEEPDRLQLWGHKESDSTERLTLSPDKFHRLSVFIK